ncbi:primosomal protein, partial [bacterium]|nr:primosomal protein [bacterium]
MKLMIEQIDNVRFFTEEKEGKKKFYITGPFIQTEQQNRNGRVYRMSYMNNVVEKYNNDYVKTGRALGELGHPSGPTIGLDRVSHKIVSLKREGNDFIGKAEILDTPMGNIARNLLESGVQLGVSTRGMGSIKEKNGIMEVQDDFFLATAADIVADPSAPNAFVQGIMEGVEWVWDNGLLKQQTVESYKATIKNVSRAEYEQTAIKVFEHFLS